ncbi:MAG: hypothetical protein BWY74_00337 [Firmicutes bacterium ADurb.Bin419]|nr:MAG: hypothetical protein BWY74_00337 [Firmicutes bacterium ADurb.Bin419]
MSELNFIIEFNSGEKFNLTAKQAEVLDALWKKSKENPEVKVTLGGKKFLVKDLKSINQITSPNNITKDNVRKIADYARNSNISPEKLVFHLNLIEKNIKRLKEGKSWIYYDLKGNIITREEADKLYKRPDSTTQSNQATEWAKEVFHS